MRVVEGRQGAHLEGDRTIAGSCRLAGCSDGGWGIGCIRHCPCTWALADGCEELSGAVSSASQISPPSEPAVGRLGQFGVEQMEGR